MICYGTFALKGARCMYVVEYLGSWLAWRFCRVVLCKVSFGVHTEEEEGRLILVENEMGWEV